MEDLEHQRLIEEAKKANEQAEKANKDLKEYEEKKEKLWLGMVPDRFKIINKQKENIKNEVIKITIAIINESKGLEGENCEEYLTNILELKEHPWLIRDERLRRELVDYWWDLHAISQKIISKNLESYWKEETETKINEHLFKIKKFDKFKIQDKNRRRAAMQRIKDVKNLTNKDIKNFCGYCGEIHDTGECMDKE